MEFIRENFWVFVASTILLVSFLAGWLVRKFFALLAPKLDTGKHDWVAAVCASLRLPLTLLCFVIGLVGIGVYILEHFAILPQGISFWLLFHVLVGLALIWAFISFSRKAEEIILSKKKPLHDRMSLDVVIRILRIALILGGFLLILPLFNISVAGILAFSGAGTIIVGIAARDMLANIFGGVLLNFDQPFRLGDWVSSPDKQIEGIVEHIGWRVCKIRSFEKRPIYVPNALFATMVLENATRMSHRRIRKFLNLRYSDAPVITDVIADIRTYLSSHDHIDKKMPCLVKLSDLGADCLEILVQAYTRKTDFESFTTLREEIYLEIIKIVHQHKADFAYPTSTVHVDSIHTRM